MQEQYSVASDVSRVIICVNTLPVLISRNQATGIYSCEFNFVDRYEEGPLYSSIGSELRKRGIEVLFVGMIPRNVHVLPSEHEPIQAALNTLNCFAVWPGTQERYQHFQGYCKKYLWPIFHNIIDLYGPVVREHTDAEELAKLESDGDMFRIFKNNGSSIKKMPLPTTTRDCVDDVDYKEEHDASWKAHCSVNKKFAQKVVEVYSDGDIVWVHDYHLMILPGVLLRKLPKANVGLYLHIPFPSSECFRVLGHKDEILRSMLSADHVGFQLYEHARHFFTCCKRLLGFPAESDRGGTYSVKYHQRKVYVTSSHVGMPVDDIKSKLSNDQNFQRVAAELVESASRNGFSKTILGIDEVEGLRGISLKLQAFDEFLSTYGSNLRGRVLLRQVGIHSDARNDDYLRTTFEIRSLVSKLNKKYGVQVVEYIEVKSLDIQDRLALYASSDMFLCCEVRSGLDVAPLEYILAGEAKPGVVVLSQFSASSRILHGSLKENPFATTLLASHIHHGLTLDGAERLARRSRDLAVIEGNPLGDWCLRILEDIRMGAKNSEQEQPVRLGFGLALSKTSPHRRKGGIRRLDPVLLCQTFQDSDHRLLVFDYSGTLVETSSVDLYFKKGGEARSWHYRNGGTRRPGGTLETRDPISREVKSHLRALASKSQNVVALMSTDLRDELEYACRDIPNVVLIAENGYVFKLPGQSEWESVVDKSGSGVWYTRGSGHALADFGEGSESVEDDMEGWQDKILQIMMPYAGRTNGSFCWKAPSAVTFNCVLADPEAGFMQTSSLFAVLEAELAGIPLTLEKGKGFVTVRMAGVNRGAAVAAIISKINRKIAIEAAGSDSPHHSDKLDFVLCMGDDVEDEVVFSTALKYKEVQQPSANIFSIRVGSTFHSSSARFHVDDVSDVENILHDLVNFNNNESFRAPEMRKSMSVVDFHSGEDVEAFSSNFVTKSSFSSAAIARKKNAIQRQGAKSSLLSVSSIVRDSDAQTTEGLSAVEDESESFPGRQEVKTYENVVGRSYADGWQKSSGLNRPKKPGKNVSFAGLKSLGKPSQTGGDAGLYPTHARRSSMDRGAMPHSPSFVATPEELEEMFSSSKEGPETVPGIPPSSGETSLQNSQDSNEPAMLGDQESDSHIFDVRSIPPTSAPK